MKTRRSSPNAISVAGLITVWTLFSALAQPNSEATPAQTGTNAAKADTFVFDGGRPQDFVRAVEKYYGVDWHSIAEIPGEMRYAVRIPKLRVPWQPSQVHKDRSVEAENVTSLITLYNRLAEHRPELGTLVVEGDPLRPSAVMFVPDKTLQKAQPPFKVKAFSLAQVPKADWGRLGKDIAEAQDQAEMFADVTGAHFVAGGHVNIHEETNLLVAMGSEVYVEMVASIVDAHCVNAVRPGTN